MPVFVSCSSWHFWIQNNESNILFLFFKMNSLLLASLHHGVLFVEAREVPLHIFLLTEYWSRCRRCPFVIVTFALCYCANYYFLNIKSQSSFVLWINLKFSVKVNHPCCRHHHQKHITHFKEKKKLYSPSYSKQLHNIPNKISVCGLYITVYCPYNNSNLPQYNFFYLIHSKSYRFPFGNIAARSKSHKTYTKW